MELDQAPKSEPLQPQDRRMGVCQKHRRKDLEGDLEAVRIRTNLQTAVMKMPRPLEYLFPTVCFEFMLLRSFMVYELVM